MNFQQINAYMVAEFPYCRYRAEMYEIFNAVEHLLNCAPCPYRAIRHLKIVGKMLLEQ